MHSLDLAAHPAAQSQSLALLKGSLLLFSKLLLESLSEQGCLLHLCTLCHAVCSILALYGCAEVGEQQVCLIAKPGEWMNMAASSH